MSNAVKSNHSLQIVPSHIKGQTARKVAQLRTILPYPAQWYFNKSESQIHAIYRNHSAKLAERAVLLDESIVADKVRKYHAKNSGDFELICINKRSFRFKFVKDGAERHGIVSAYGRKNYDDSNGSYKLPKGSVMVTWDSSKKTVYTTSHLISYVCDCATNDPRYFVEAIYKIIQ